ncbi:MAG: ribonuclease R, partial [Candidatus Delongbacteria bacterium]|nr:ribonuclease R [Candidatus Delongbacteria bacterium]
MTDQKSEKRLRQDIIAAITAAGKLRTRELYNRLQRPGNYENFKIRLTALLREGEILRAAKRTWCLPQSVAAANGISGVLHLTSSGKAFVMPEDGSERMFIRRVDLGGAVQGDTVQVRPQAPQRGAGAEGRVTAILQRGLKQLVGRIERYGRRFVLVPYGAPLTGTVFIRHSQLALEEGMHVLVRLIYREERAQRTVIEADVIRTYAEASRAELLQETIRCTWLLEADFPEAVLQEAEQLDELVQLQTDLEKPLERRDLRHWTLFTIDPDDARDFDDAVSLEPLPDGGYRLGVHIADVSHYVRPGCKLDQEALQRGTSVYLVGEVIPMLPHRLSTDLCSLREGEDRYAMTCLIDYDRQGRRRSYELFPSLICSARRLDYKAAQVILEGFPLTQRQDYDPQKELADPVERSLYYMNHLFRKLLRHRLRAGSLDFSTPEPRFQLDEEGVPVSVKAIHQMDSNRLIEEFMLAANRVVAEHLLATDVPAIFRIHDVPSGEKLLSFTEFIRHLGVDVDEEALRNVITWQQILQQFRGKELELVLQQVVLRSMMKAGYGVENRGHFGLAFEAYTHFTSPIRRYPDLLIHRILKQQAHGETLAERELKRAAQISSTREINAMEAERESIKVKQLLYLEDQVGERFRGIIRGIQRFGLFVELEEILADGLVPVAALADDYYVYDEKAWTLTGRKQGVRFMIGQPVVVEVTRCSVDERKLDLKIVESLEPVSYHDGDNKKGQMTDDPVKVKPQRQA